ncbi:MAG TPA: selenoneine biosynthesis selenosugar synthase SenB [Burkholderiales bacterium]|jgi:putative glycosyltransferase (TIGR04348 family)|nr:selenoneine biosynthesis selenosugar synthase SenB [Burkholderiales bacterium]
MRIALVTPAKAGSRAGNRHTALRWAAMLRAQGHKVTVSTEWEPNDKDDLLLALHARRSHGSIEKFRATHPNKPIVLALTGTDVYRDIKTDKDAKESLELATRFIVLQPKAIKELPKRLRSKARVVYQSCSTRLKHKPVKRKFRLCVIGHLREEKDPLRGMYALRHLPDDLNIELVQIGDSLDDKLADEARGMEQDKRYRWLGSVPHSRALQILASSHAMIISSRMEGGANVVSEAVRIGVPVIASKISGNVGLLGDQYAGYYPLGNERALAALILRTAREPRFYHGLIRKLARLRPIAGPGNEKRMLGNAIAAGIRQA